ncbi:MAG: protein kinase domain-containing protein [Nannocystales bacterium]
MADDPELFDRVMDLPVDEREAAVEAVCAGDEARARRLIELVRIATAAGADFIDTPPALDKGNQFGRFCVVSLLGEGSFGQVYDALDLDLERRVALKVLHPDRSRSEADDRRFQREARVLARIDHPNVVRVHHAGVIQGRRFLAMERVEGASLRGWIREAPALGWSAVLERLLPAARALAAAHEAGIVHRDFKPENVMFDEARQRVVVADFGIARVDRHGEIPTPSEGPVETDALSTASTLGTPEYMAPEQFYGEASAKSDQFAFCRVVLEALGGTLCPVPLPTVSPVTEEAAAEPEPVRAPRWLRRVLTRGTDPEPAARYPDMEALTEALIAHQRRRRGTLITLLVLAAALPSAYAVARPDTGPCQVWNAAGLEDTLAPHWEQMKARATSEPSAVLVAEMHRRTHRSLNRWAAARTESCRQHAAGLVDDATAEARDHCFARWERRLTRRVAWSADVSEALLSPRLARVLPDNPERCGYVSPVGARPEPLDNSTRTALERSIEDAETSWILGRYAQSRDAAQKALARARAADHEAFGAEALHRLGVLAARRGDAQTAIDVLLEALELAQRQGQAQLTYSIQYHLTETLIVEGRVEAASPVLALARAQLARLAERPRLRAELTVLEGHLAQGKGQLTSAAEAYQDAAERFAEIEDGALGSAAAREFLAEMLSAQDRHDEATLLADRAFADRVQSLGSTEHPLLVDARVRTAGVHVRAAKAASGAAARRRHLMVAREHAAAATTLSEVVHGRLSAPFAWALTLRTRVELLEEENVGPAVAHDATELVNILETLDDFPQAHRVEALRVARNVQHARADWARAEAAAALLVESHDTARPPLSTAARDDELILISYLAHNGNADGARRRLRLHEARYATNSTQDAAYREKLDRLHRGLSSSAESDDP